MFRISEKMYKVIFPAWGIFAIIGAITQATFIPSDGYKTFSYIFIWIFAIWLAVASTPHMEAYAKKNNLIGKNLPSEIRIFLSILVFAHINGLIFFQSIPLVTKHISTSKYSTFYKIRAKEHRPQRAILACDQYLKLDESFYYGKLCVTKTFFDKKKGYDSVSVTGDRNIIGFYINEYY